jgi:PAS domain S-box-containing protein
MGRDVSRGEIDQRAAAAVAAPHYRAVLDAIDVGFCIIELLYDGDGNAVDYRFIEVNAAFEAQSGVVGAVGCTILQLHPDHDTHWFAFYDEVVRTGEPRRTENGSVPLDRWWDVHALRLGAAEDRRVAVLFADISDRRRMEEELRAANAQLAERAAERTRERDAIWTASRDLFVTIGDDGRYRAVNPAWQQTLGWTAAELVGAAFTDFVHRDDLAGVAAMAARAETGEDIAEVDVRMRASDGGHRWISWSIVRRDAIFYAAGRDITDRHLLEEQLRQSQKMEAVGQLTGGLAHDFNNLLTAVTGGLELLSHRIAAGRTDGLDRYVDMAQAGARRAAALTQRLLAFSRRQALDPTPTDIDRLVAGMQEIVARTIGPAIDMRVVATPALWPVLVDAPQLESALLNLCINARDAMPDGGTLTIETGNQSLDARAAAAQDLPEGDYVSLCVTDTGTGMTPEVRARVFDPFFTTKPIGEGTGLGLSMIYGFIRQSGGQIRIYTEVGGGTTMCLYLPRLAGEAASPVERAAIALPPARGAAGETVLVVEDDEAIRTLVHEILTDAGYRVLAARDGPAGLQLLRSGERIDLLITDVGLPGGLNGRDVADAGRAARPALKILFVTGYAANAAIGAGHLDPGMAVLTKPFNILDLERRVREMIGTA